MAELPDDLLVKLREPGVHDVSGLDLAGKNLRGAHLEHARGLTARQLRGADLTNARLPEQLKKFETLKVLENASKAAGRVWATAMLACLYCWLTIGGTTDAQFFGAEHETTLPFIQMKMPMTGFYAVAPLILLVVFLYLQFSLQTVWEIFATLPAVFPDGRRLHERAAPFFLSSIVRAQFPILGANAGLAKWQARLAWLLGWWVVPFTLCWLWERSLVARLWWITAPQIASIGIAIASALFFIRFARNTLRGGGTQGIHWRSFWQWARHSKLRWEVLAAIGALGAFGLLSLGGYSFSKVSADLEFATLSLPKNEVEANDFGHSAGRGVNLKNRDLRNADAYGAEIWGADLSRSDLRGADFLGADLRKADLEDARLFQTSFFSSDLQGSSFSVFKGDKCGALFMGANLQGARFVDLGPCADEIRESGQNWILATYNNPEQLHLPSEHRESLINRDLSGYSFSKLGSLFMQRADLHGWNLQNTNFSGADLDDADLSKSDMRGAVLDQTRVIKTNFEGADLRGADLRQARGLTQAQVNTMITDKSTKLPEGLHSPLWPPSRHG
ncbi:MAG TPA: pentapeptide repeat-containing protein [Bryobacteraceae bacterium]|jgi:uncharacterized protein YjbI with pentapeptide repeats|nr:pentapeptide repeat-containing protein [Bryobacteraceae bacterium]